jgi:hypothetical protein
MVCFRCIIVNTLQEGDNKDNNNNNNNNSTTPWSRVLLGKLTVPQLVKKFPTFYATLKFITAFTSARQLSLS